MALDFDGVDDQVDHGDIAGIDSGSALSVAYWLFYDTLATADNHIGKTQAGVNFSFISGSNAATNTTWDLQIPAGTITAVEGMFETGVWHHYGFTYDGAVATTQKIQAYRDGVLISTASYAAHTTSMPDTGANGVIVAGNGGDASRAFPDAKIANVKLWTAALTAAEITQETHSHRPVRTADLRLWAPYESRTADPTDYSGAGNHGTITGALVTDGPPVGGGFPVQVIP